MGINLLTCFVRCALLTACLAALLVTGGALAAEPAVPEPAVVDELIAIADADDPGKLAGLTLGETKFDAKHVDKVIAALEEHVKKADDAGKPLKHLKLIVPATIKFGEVLPVMKALIAALPDLPIRLVARLDEKQAETLKSKDKDFALVEGEAAFNPPHRTRPVFKDDPLRLEQPIGVTLNPRGKWGHYIGLDRSPKDPTSMRELKSMLSGMLEGNGGFFQPDTPVIIKAGRELAWSHVVQAIAATQSAGYQRVALANLFDEDKPVTPAKRR